MSTIENKITKLGYELPNESAPLANYVPVVLAEQSKLISIEEIFQEVDRFYNSIDT